MFMNHIKLTGMSALYLVLFGCLSIPLPGIPDRQSPKEPSADAIVDELAMPSGFQALDDGDQYVLLQWVPIALADAQVELEVRTVEEGTPNEWSNVAVVPIGEAYYVHGPVTDHLEFRARMVRGESVSEWAGPVSIDMRCDEMCGNNGGDAGFVGEGGVGGEAGFVGEGGVGGEAGFVGEGGVGGDPGLGGGAVEGGEGGDAGFVGEGGEGGYPGVGGVAGEGGEGGDAGFVGEAGNGAIVDETPTVAAPNTPENLNAEVTRDGVIRVTWSVTGGPVEHFELQRRRIPAEGPTEWRGTGGQIGGDVRSTLDSPAARNIFQYRLRAHGPLEASGWSRSNRVDHSPPQKPSAFALERGNGHKVKMTWRHSGDRLSGFVIERYKRRVSGEWTGVEEVIEAGRNARQKNDEPSQSREYRYCIRATGPSGDSGNECQRIDLRN